MSMHSDIKVQDSVGYAADVAKLLADPTRLKILVALFRASDDLCVYEIAETVGSSQSATSHQLAKLELYGIVVCYREGQKMCYALTRAPIVSTVRKTLVLFDLI